VVLSPLSGWLLLGLILSPLVFLIARPFSWDRTRLYVAGGTFFVLWPTRRSGAGCRLPQNYLSIAGSYSSAFLSNRPDVIPQTVWDLLVPLGCVSGGLLAGVLVGRLRRLRPELACYAVFMIGGTLLEVVEGQILFDRYVLPIALPVVALLLSEPLRTPKAEASARERRTRLALGGASGLFVGVITTLMTANALSFDAATWHAAEAVVSSGKASVDYVDAGLDWTGYYSPDGMQDQPDLYAEPGIYGYSPRLGRDAPCYVVASRPQSQPNWTLVETPSYRVYGFFGNTEYLDVYRTEWSVCDWLSSRVSGHRQRAAAVGPGGCGGPHDDDCLLLESRRAAQRAELGELGLERAAAGGVAGRRQRADRRGRAAEGGHRLGAALDRRRRSTAGSGAGPARRACRRSPWPARRSAAPPPSSAP
jgi:hypothetical protein